VAAIEASAENGAVADTVHADNSRPRGAAEFDNPNLAKLYDKEECRAMLVNEVALLRLFTELTGETESAARCVIMYLEMLERDYFPQNHPDALAPAAALVQNSGGEEVQPAGLEFR